MLKKIYIDNWRCFVNFECQFDSINLLTGANGTGKSSVIDALGYVCGFVGQNPGIFELFLPESITRWSPPERMRQTFEMEVELDGQIFHYTLVVGYDHSDPEWGARVLSESLELDGETLFSFTNEIVQRNKDNLSQWPMYKHHIMSTGLREAEVGIDHQRWERFLKWTEQVHTFRLNPTFMDRVASDPSTQLDRYGGNFADWYLKQVQEHPDMIDKLTNRLQDIWSDFRGLELKQFHSCHILEATFGDKSYSFEELSDGQRCLIVLNALLCFAQASEVSLIAFDEVLNFVALREIQPWLAEWVDLADDGKVQVLFSGHHPEVIDFLGMNRTLYLTRKAGGPTRVGPLEFHLETTMTPSRLISMGLEEAVDE